MEVLHLGPASVVRAEGVSVLIDCAEGSWERWRTESLPDRGPDAIAFTRGTPAYIAGLYGMLAGMAAAGRTRPIRILHSMNEERVGNLVGAYLQSEPAVYPVTLEADLPGATLVVGSLRLTSRSVPEGLAWSVRDDDRTVELGGLDN